MVTAQEVEYRNQEKYGHLLDKAREYLKGKTTIKPEDLKLQETVKSDYRGESWLIDKLIQDGRLKKVTKYKSEDQPDELKYYEVIKPNTNA